MPYIVTAYKRRIGTAGKLDKLSETAVATLGEAREALQPRYMTALAMLHYGAQVDTRAAGRTTREQIQNLPESGGTIGPLPDGTMIEVQRIDWKDLRDAVGTFRVGFDLFDHGIQRALLEAFNKR